MAELITVARPYAEAVFRLAKDEGRLAQWEEALVWLAATVREPAVAAFVSDPERTPAEIEAMLTGVLGDKADAEVKNLVAALAENRRLVLLPAIADQFDQLKQAEEGVLTAHIASAFPLTDSQSAELAATLKAKYGKEIQLEVSEDSALLGGVRIQIGDDVIDASVRGKLQAMAVSLKS